MRTALFNGHLCGGGCVWGGGGMRLRVCVCPGSVHPRIPRLTSPRPRGRHPPGSRGRPPCHTACCDTHPLAHCMLGYTPSVNRMTDRCKNITLPQTSFACGKNLTRTYHHPQRYQWLICLSLQRYQWLICLSLQRYQWLICLSLQSLEK